MSAHNRAVAVIAVVAALALGFLALAGSAWHPVVAGLAGNSDLGQTSEFDGTTPSPVGAFYTPPTPLPEIAPGAVLKSEPIPEAPPGVRAWRVMYVSLDNNGQPIPITAYYAEPDRQTLTGFPLVALAHGTTGLAPACGMSQAPFTAGTTGYEYWNFLGRQLVANGYAIVVTDYEGMGAPGTPTYLLRKQGYDLLDSVRAAIRLRPQTVNAQNVGLIGHSEGAYTVLAAADMAAAYAPDLMIRGAVSIAPGGVPAIPFAIDSLVASSGASGPGPRNGYFTYLVSSWSASYPELLPLDSILTPEGMTAIPAAVGQCQGQIINTLNQPMTNYFKTDLPLELVTVAARNQPITTRTAIPTLIVQGELDKGIVPQVTRGFANLMCDYGSTVEYRQLSGDVHRSSVFSSVPLWTDYFDARFAGEPAPSTCKGH